MSDTPKQPEPNTEETQSVKKPEETKLLPTAFAVLHILTFLTPGLHLLFIPDY